MADAPRPRLSGAALAAFFLGLAGLLLQLFAALPALFLSLASLRAINASDGRLAGRRLAVTGLLLGAAVTAFNVFAFVWLIVLHFRATADRTACMDNLRRLGLATGLYTVSQKTFPPATYPALDLAPARRTSWIALILPYADHKPAGPRNAGGQEGDPLADWREAAEQKPANRRYAEFQERLALAKPWDEPPNLEASRVVLPFCVCRSHPAGDALQGRTDYVGFSGLGIDAATYPAKDPRDGAFGYDRLLRPAEVTAGLGQTLLAAETSRDNGPWIAGGPPTVRGLDPDEEDYIGAERPFGGFHPGGMNALWMDGHVEFLNQRIRPELLRELVLVRREPR
jgi:prepilin-type processing-associated H-X9-DG protein